MSGEKVVRLTFARYAKFCGLSAMIGAIGGAIVTLSFGQIDNGQLSFDPVYPTVGAILGAAYFSFQWVSRLISRKSNRRGA